MNQLLETLRVELINDTVIVYDLLDHSKRLFRSALELDFKIKSDFQNFHLLLLNQIKNKAQYLFNKSVAFADSKFTTQNSMPFYLKQAAEIFKLRLIYSNDASFNISIEPYTRDLNKAWQARILSTKEFHSNSNDKQYKHKIYPRPNLSEFFDKYTDEIIWLNENGHLCEGSFTNIIFQNHSLKWCSPSLGSGILAGIMRKKIIENFDIEEGLYYPQEIKSLVLCNSMLVKEATLLHH